MELIHDSEYPRMINQLKTSKNPGTVWVVEPTDLDDAVINGLADCRKALDDSQREDLVLVGSLLL